MITAKQKNIGFSFVLLFATLFFIFCIFEGTLRLFYPQSDYFWKIGEDIEGLTLHIPNKDGYWVSEEFKTYIKINEEGWRDVDRNYERKPDDVFRILLSWGFICRRVASST